MDNSNNMSPEEFDKFKKELEEQIKKMMKHMGFDSAQIIGPFKVDPKTGQPILPPGMAGMMPPEMMEQMMQGMPMGGGMDRPEMTDDIDPITGRPKTKIQLEHEKKNLYGKDIQKDDISDLAINLNTINTIDEFLKTL